MAPKKTRRAAADSTNGLRNFALHSLDAKSATALDALRSERSSTRSFAAATTDVKSDDPETAATRYLQQALASAAVPNLTTPKADGVESQFKTLGTETVPLADMKVVKFRQTFHNIPVYGSLVSVELGERNELLSISSSLGEPRGVAPVAKVSPAEASKKVKEVEGADAQLENAVPRLYYYFDAPTDKWRLVYIFEDVPVVSRKRSADSRVLPRYKDYVVDAHTGAMVAQLPRTPSFASKAVRARDGLGKSRSIRVEKKGATTSLHDSKLNINTYDFGFRDPSVQEAKLPGAQIVNPPAWQGSAVSAHANAAAVAVFLRKVLLRSNLDANGGPMNSSVNCVVAAESEDGREWFNAFWNGDQMVYGQRRNGPKLMSLAVNLDVVGHEMFHGVTDFTARLEYANQSGALNESISDIFGVIISNGRNPDPRTWDWEVGDGLSPDGEAFRDMKDPTRFDQPAHMDEYQVLPNTSRGDYGGVHVNSGIHNKAAYLMLTHTGPNGRLTLKPREVAAVFYIALTQHLSRTSQFSDSRRAALVSARTLFRKLKPSVRDAKVKAIAASFTAVGIKD